jgi:lipid-binding SYLF domain-containing protein
LRRGAAGARRCAKTPARNKELYGREVTNREIVTGKVPPPAVAEEFLKALSKY